MNVNIKLETYDDPGLYRLSVDSYLRVNLAECNHLFSAIHGLTPEIAMRRRSWMARLHKNGNTCGIVLINSLLPARVASMSGIDADAVALVADALCSEDLVPTAIVGPPDTVELLAEHLARQRSMAVGARMRLGNHMLATEPIAPPCDGQWRAATADDIDLLVRWENAFVAECRLPDSSQDLHREISERIASPTALCWLWEVNGRPVAMALGRCLPPVGRVGVVYTDPAHRGHGYAGALVAQISRRLLAQGCDAVFLFTDMANPVSNGVYRRIGYRLLGEVAEIELDQMR